MKRILLLLGLFTALSCNFETKKIHADDILKEELQTFSWNDVDEYPTFASCDSALSKVAKKRCFENTIRSLLNAHLSTQQIVVTNDVNDTINLKITIDKTGAFSLDTILCHPSTRVQIKNLDSLLIHGFDSLPKIYPAIKRSQQVTTQFSLPVVVHIN